MGLDTILSKDILSKIPKELHDSLLESINTYTDSKVSRLESEMKTKFEEFTSSLEVKFDNQVNTVLTESVNTNFHEKVNKKMLSLINGIAVLLENAGINVTEKTAALEEKLKKASEDLVNAYNVREELKEELDDAKKQKYIYSSLTGMRPELVVAAIEHFKNSDIVEVEAELEDFVSNYAKKVPASSELDELDELDIDKVTDALDEIERDDLNNELNKSRFESVDFDRLSKGLKKPRVPHNKINNNITDETLTESESAIVESMESLEQPNVIPQKGDAEEALDKINDFKSLGLGFTFGKPKK